MDALARLLARTGGIVALGKPPGLSLATPAREPGAAVARLLAALPAAERAGLPETLLLVHRLDVFTSGVVLLAESAEVHRALTLALQERRVVKTYLALVWGRPRPGSGVYDAPLGPDRADRRRMRVDPAGRPARSRYRVAAVARPVALVELTPETGRTHQLRVHLAAAGHPIVGDDLYGGPRHRGVRDPALRRLLDPGHTLLHAWKIEIPSPPLAAPLAAEAPLPERFAAALEGLGISPILPPPCPDRR